MFFFALHQLFKSMKLQSFDRPAETDVVLYGIDPPLLWPTYWASTSILHYIDPLTNPIILHSFHMVEPSSILSFNIFVNQHNCLILAFGALSILLIPSKPLEVFHLYILILNISFHIIVSLPCIRTGMSNDWCKTIAHSSCKPLALTKDLIEPATFLPHATFLRHYASSALDSSKTHPKYLNSDTCSTRIPSTQTSHSNPSSPPNTITLLLSALTFKPPLLNASLSLPTRHTKPNHLLQEARQYPSLLIPLPLLSLSLSLSH